MTLFSRLSALAVLATLGLAPAWAAPAPAPAVAAPPSAPAAEPVAQRGSMKLTADDVREMIKRADPAVRAQLMANPAALSEFVRDRLMRRALLEQAKSVGFDQKPDVVARINDARDSVIVTSYVASLTEPDPGYPSQAEIAAAYEGNKSRFVVPRQYQIAQIAVRLPVGSSAKADEEAKARILDIRQQLNKPNANFADLARKYSDDRNSADKGGDLGWLREDQLVPAVKDAVAGMAENAISEPVRTPEGWHILKLSGVRPSSIAPLADVSDSIAAALRQQRAQQNARAFVEDLLRKEPIQLNEIELAKSVGKPR
jgi:parvulin-like peptidyl-prolyl isomerase